MKTSLVITVFNEEKTITGLLDSILNQSVMPTEVVIVDGGSTDATIERIKNYESRIKNIKVLTKKGNRSIGRNEGIKNSTHEIILITDAGCVLDKDWVAELSKHFKDEDIKVVAGYYKGDSKTIFQKCIVPYVLVMPDKVDEQSFLPAARSMAIKKTVWERFGGFDPHLSHNEDYAFAMKLKKNGVPMVFEKKAIVEWIPRKNLMEAFVMFYRFAYGDAEAGIYRPKAFLVILRYVLFIVIFCISIVVGNSINFLVIGILMGFYISWSIKKNYKYVKKISAAFLLPIIQITSDIAVILGTTFGLVKSLTR